MSEKSKKPFYFQVYFPPAAAPVQNEMSRLESTKLSHLALVNSHLKI